MTGKAKRFPRVVPEIRKLCTDDADDLAQLLSDPLVMKYLEPPFTKGKAESFLIHEGLCETPRIYAAVIGDTFLGYVIYHAYDSGSMEIGWVLKKEYWHKGYASSLCEQLIQNAFHEKKDAVIECTKDHAVTIHIAQKYHFQYQGESGQLLTWRLPRCTERNCEHV